MGEGVGNGATPAGGTSALAKVMQADGGAGTKTVRSEDILSIEEPTPRPDQGVVQDVGEQLKPTPARAVNRPRVPYLLARSQRYSGPLPQADDFLKYESAGYGDRIVALAERDQSIQHEQVRAKIALEELELKAQIEMTRAEQEARNRREDKKVDTLAWRTKAGFRGAIAFAFFMGTIAYYAIRHDHTKTAVALMSVGGLPTIIGAFLQVSKLKRRRVSQAEPEDVHEDGVDSGPSEPPALPPKADTKALPGGR